VTFWDHLLAELVPTAVMAFIVVTAVAAVVLVAYLSGVRHGRRDAWQTVNAMCAGFEEQIAKTVPMLTRDGGR
jgi:hypothetical protein